MTKITFKVAYLAAGTTPRVISLLKEDKKGATTFIDDKGMRFERPPASGEKVAQLVLTSFENHDFHNNGNDDGSPLKRAFGVFSYVPTDESLEGADSRLNRIHREAHELLRSHQNVLWLDENGVDKNLNRYGCQVMFELIEETERIKAENERHKAITKANVICTDLFENRKEEFIDLCYAWGITQLEETPIETVYNEAMFRIDTNPFHFLNIYEDKDREIKALIGKATTRLMDNPLNSMPTTVISFEDNVYYMDGEIIAENYDKLVHMIKSDLRLRERIQRALGITPAPLVEVKELAPTKDDLSYSKGEIQYARTADAARIEEMNKSVVTVLKKYEAAVAKNPLKKPEAEKALEADLAKRREHFKDIENAFDDFVAKRKGFYVK